MARKSRRARRRFTRGKINYAWDAAIISGTQAAGTFLASDIIAPADYEIGALQGNILLEAIYCNVTVTNVAAAASAVNDAILGIVVCDEDISAASGTMDPDNVTNLTDQRWLWTKRVVVPTGDRGNTAYQFKVKSRARLIDSDVRFVTSNSDGVESYDYSADFRALLRLP